MTNAAEPAVDRRFVAWSALVIVATAFAIYANSFQVPLLLDDPTTIVHNPSIRRLSAMGQVLFPPAEIYSAGRPLLNLSFALNYAIGQTAVGGYHVVNTLIHVLAALILFGLVRRTLQQPTVTAPLRAAAGPLALCVALLWVAHPVQTVSVTYVSQRAESLMGLWYLLTLYAFVRAVDNRDTRWLAAAVAACACGMATKEVMVTAPVVTLLYDRQFVAGTFSEVWRRRRGFYLTLAATWVLLFALIFSSGIGHRGIGGGESLSRFDYASIECRAILHYLRVSLWPDPLVFDFGPQLAVPRGWELIWRGALVLALVGASVFGLLRGRALGFLGAAFFLLLSPTSSFVPVAGQPIAENRVYLPLAAVTVALVVGVFSILRTRPRFVAAAALLSFAWMAHARNITFQHELDVWTDTVRKQPTNARAAVMLSVAQSASGRPDLAIATTLRALERMPTNAELHNNLGIYLFNAGQVADGIAHLREAIRLKPEYDSAHLSLGQILLGQNDSAGAAEAFSAVVRLQPENADARNLLGVALAQTGRTAEAIAEFEAALRLRPDFEQARANLAAVRGQTNR